MYRKKTIATLVAVGLVASAAGLSGCMGAGSGQSEQKEPVTTIANENAGIKKPASNENKDDGPKMPEGSVTSDKLAGNFNSNVNAEQARDAFEKQYYQDNESSDVTHHPHGSSSNSNSTLDGIMDILFPDGYSGGYIGVTEFSGE